MSNTASNKQADYLDYVLTIKQFFNRHRNGGYMFAVSYSYPLKKEVNKEVIDYCSGLNLNVGETTLHFDIEKTCLQQLREAKEQFENGLILTNVDELMLTHDEFAYQLNQMREALFALQIPILIWLSPETHSAFTYKAIDLYTRRDLDTVFFPEIEVKHDDALFERSEMQLGQEEDAETLRTRIVLLESQLEAARQDEVPRSRVANEIVFPLIKAYRQLLMLERAIELINEFEQTFEENKNDLLSEIGQVYFQNGNMNLALAYFQKALQNDVREHGENSVMVACDLNNLSLTWMGKGNLDFSVEASEKSLSIYTDLLGEKNMLVVTGLNNLGSIYKAKGELDKAIDFLTKSIELKLGILGEFNISVSKSYNNLGMVWLDKGDFDKATFYLNKSLSIRIKLSGEFNQNVSTSYNNLGAIWRKLNPDKALEYFRRSFSIDIKLYGEKSHRIAGNYNNIGGVFLEKGDFHEALDYFNKALDIDKILADTNGSNTAIYYINISNAWQKMGDTHKAAFFFNKAQLIRSKLQEESHHYIADIETPF